MALSNGPNLGVLVDGEPGEAHYDEIVHQWRAFDLLIQCNVLSIEVEPPDSPDDGDAYIVGADATDDWDGHDGEIARWSDALDTPAWEFFTPKAGWQAFVVDESAMYRHDGADWFREPTFILPVACGDETSAITTGTGKVTFHMPVPMKVFEVIAEVTTAQTSGSALTVDVNKGGTTIFSTPLTIDNTEETSSTAATPAVLSTTSLAKGDKIRIDVDQVGDGTAKGLKIWLVGRVG
jgi:hypothetical protein